MRWLKRGLLGFAAALVLLMVSAAAFLLWLNSDSGHAWLAHSLSTDVDSDTLDIDIKAIDGDIYGAFTVAGLRLADKGGVWLDAPELDIVWSPTDLLSGELHVRNLGGRAIAFTRVPEGGEKDPQASGGLPVAIRLDHAALAVTYEGDSYRLDISEAAFDEGRARGSLRFENSDKTDMATAAFIAAEDGSTFDLKLDVAARKGGLVTGLLGLGADDSLTAQASASGSFAAWAGDMVANVPGKLDVRADGGAEDGIWKITLQQARNAFVPDVLQRALGHAVAADITIKPQALDDLELMLDLNGAGMQATLFGKLSLKDGFSATDGKLSAELDRLETGSVTLRTIALEGGVAVKDGRFVLSGYRASAEALVVTGSEFGAVAATGNLAAAGRGLSGAVDTLAATVTPPGLDEMRVEASGGAWSYDIGTEAWAVQLAALDGRGLSAKGVSARGDRSGLKSAAGQAVMPAAFLKPLHGGALTAGQLDLDIRSTGTVAGGARLSGTVAGSGLAFESAALGELVGAAPTLEAKLVVGDDGSLRIEAAALRSARLALDTKGRVEGERLDLSFEGTVGETEKLLGDGAVLTGDTAFKGSVKGATAAPRISFETGFASVDAYGVMLKEPAITLLLAPERGKGGLSGDVKLSALSPLGHTAFTSPLRISDGTVSLSDVQITAPGAEGKGSIVWQGEDGLAATLNLVLAPLKDERFDLGGEGGINIAFAMKEGRMDAGLSLDLNGIRFARPGTFPVTIETAKGTVNVTRDGKAISYAADLEASNISKGAQKIDTLSVKGTSADSDPLHATLAGYFGNRFDLTLAAKPRPGGVDITFTGAYGDVGAAAEEAVMVRWGGQEDLRLDMPRLELAGGTVKAAATVKGHDMSVSAEARGLAMSMINLARPGSVEAGTVDADINFNREGGSEVGKATLAFRDLTLPRWRLAAAPDTYAGGLTATMQGGTLSFEGTMVEAGVEFGRLTGRLPYERLPDSRAYAIRDGAPLAMDLVWQGDVAPIWLLARRPEHMLTGRLDGRLTLSGELSDPHFDGDLNLRDGHYEYDPLGLVADIEVLHVTGTQDHIELAELRANDTEDGVLTGKGRFELSSKLSFPGRLTAELENFRVARLDELYGKASASLVYERTETDATLSGRVRTGPMRVKMPKELPRSVVEIDVIEINSLEELEGLTFAKEPVKNRPTQLAIAIEVPGQFFFEGRGLKSEWRGDLSLGGTSDEPAITGNMTVRDGDFTFGSKVFELTEGVLVFRGGKVIDPDIAVTAVHTTPNLEAQLRIIGPSSAPEFTLTSTPALPEDEILSRILLGKSVSDLSAFQLAELVVAMDTLRGGGSFDVVGKLRRGLGLDTLSFGRSDGEDESATTVTGGKYLRKNIYLEVETSTASSETATRLKIDLTKNLLVETEIGPRQGSSLKLKWFWDY